jgi:hypothetical protein
MNDVFKVNTSSNHNTVDKKDWVSPCVELLAIDETQNGSGAMPESSNGNLAANS